MCRMIENELQSKEVVFLKNERSRSDYSDRYINVYRRAFDFGELEELCVKTATFIVTEDCNLGCTYCYQQNKTKQKMTKETAKKAVDLLFEEDLHNSKYINAKNSEAIIIDFIGGEPLLAIDIVDFVIQYFYHKAISLRHRWAETAMFHVTTNGTLNNTHKFKRLIDLYGTKLSIGITIDGNEELHNSCRVYKNSTIGSYKDVEKSFKEYLKINPQAGTKLTIAPENITYLFDGLVNCAENIGIKQIHANVVYEEGWQLEHAIELYKQLKKCADWLINNDYEEEITFSFFEINVGREMPEEDNNNYCGGTGSMLAFSPSGMITPCLRYAPLSLPSDVKPLVIGELGKSIGVEEEHKKVIEELDSITRRSQSTDECFYCPIASGCGWCSGYNYEKFGTVNKRATYICVMHKARVLANVYFWNKLYKKHGYNEVFELNVPDEWALPIIGEEELNMLKELVK